MLNEEDDHDDDQDVSHVYKREKYLERIQMPVVIGSNQRSSEYGSSPEIRTRESTLLYDSEMINNSIRQKIELEKWSNDIRFYFNFIFLLINLII